VEYHDVGLVSIDDIFMLVVSRSTVLIPVILVLVAGCAPSVEDSAEEALALLQAGSGPHDEAMVSRMTAGSGEWINRMAGSGEAAGLLFRMKKALEHGRPVDGSSGIIRGSGGEDTVFFVPDGHSNLIDLALSGISFSDLREWRYPVPW